MNLLVDAHAFLWFVWDDPQMSATAKALIADPANQKFISAGTYWEIAIKVSTGKLDLGEPLLAFLHREIARNNFTILPIGVDHAAAVSVLPFHHRDPFDRMLVAQASLEAMAIVSVDNVLDLYPITRLW